jgi:hypothetical protein
MLVRGWDDEAMGSVGYCAYAKETGGKTFDGREMPKWEDLPPNIKAAWAAAAREILLMVNGD